MRKHLAIFIGHAIEDILSGKKTMESRFSLGRIIPYEEIVKDDTILLKKSGGNVIGQVLVDNVLYYDNLKPQSIAVLRKEYSKELAMDDNFWRSKAKSKYATLIFLKKPRRFVFPIKFQKKDRRPWLILNEKAPKFRT